MSASLTINEARRHAEATVRKSGTSFGAGMAILPKKRREAMYAVYAFCREVDDVADDDGLSRGERLRRLAGWRVEVDRLYEGRPQSPIALALLEPVRAYDLPKQEFLMMIEGMEMDADGPIVAPSLERLQAYTRRVAGAVGLLSMPIFGAPSGKASNSFALSLGDALQLTNILRDVAEDAEIGRLYLPAELLARHGAPRSPSEIVGSKRLAPVARDLAAMAREKFDAARGYLSELDWRTVRPALLMMGVYEAYLVRMERRGWERLNEPLTLSKAQKLFIAARYAVAPPLAR
jgi:phytoene synthase